MYLEEPTGFAAAVARVRSAGPILTMGASLVTLPPLAWVLFLIDKVPIFGPIVLAVLAALFAALLAAFLFLFGVAILKQVAADLRALPVRVWQSL